MDVSSMAIMRTAAQARPIVVFAELEISQRWLRAHREPGHASVGVSTAYASSAAALRGALAGAGVG
jgi:hypothetical protein